MQDYKGLITSLQKSLDENATHQRKVWWEKYMKGVIQFRGVGIPETRLLLKAWIEQYGIQSFSVEDQVDLALALFREPMAEDKLAGILYLQYYLYNQLDWQILVRNYESLYRDQLIVDWSTCDWFCVRVLSPTIAQNGLDCAASISAWRTSANLWQARSSVVAFVKVTSHQSYYPYIQDSCHALIQRQERFAKTSVGWILRDISKHDQRFVKSFVEQHLKSFSVESLRNALKYIDQAERETYIKRLKAT